MSKDDVLRYGRPGETAVHLCVDMQRMFPEGTEWKMPWLGRVLPNIVAITSARHERTIFTRFIPARKPGHGVGMWRNYYEKGALPIRRLRPALHGRTGGIGQIILASMRHSRRAARLS
jgi:nicotinamidase-related amidase